MHSHAIDLDRARDQLPRLIEQAAQGDEVILTEAGEPVARITPFVPARKPRQFGSARGMIQMADDFDAPLELIRVEEALTPEELARRAWHARLRSVGIRPGTGRWPPPEFEPLRPRFYHVRRLFWPLRRYIKRFL